MKSDFVKIFVLFVVFNFCLLKTQLDRTLLLNSVLFTLSIYLIIPTIKNYKEGYEDYKLKVNGVSHLVKLLEKMFKDQQIDKTVFINNDLTKQMDASVEK